ncbi:hypothetical protein BDZ85DRAFT_263380 [Elsinoe ampelina]|uniref:C2H2-type domain-containing protein n=1 Tax=Elsinoe ampelina TaxID=302913 RepID=A0A6A6G967_9PEZI|nr:hypothetical protein BDZ85DRAFT_263380 [Elsinoe ampelina]
MVVHSDQRSGAVPGVDQDGDTRSPRRSSIQSNLREQRHPHTCTHCSRHFKRAEHLRRHTRVHTGEKPYKCFCGETFARRDLLTRHGKIAKHDVDGGQMEAVAHILAGQLQTTNSQHNQHANVQPLHDTVMPTPRQSLPQDDMPQVDPSAPSLQDMPMEQYEPYYDDSIDTFRDFVAFIDGVGMSASWTPEFDFDCTGNTNDYNEQQQLSGQLDTPPNDDADEIGTPFSTWLPSAPANGQIVSPEAVNELRHRGSNRPPYHVSEDQRSLMIASLQSFQGSTSDFVLPSRHALTRYLTAWFSGFHSHLPFIHEPTYRPSRSPIELTLAMCSVGAQYCFERRNAERLFHASKAVMYERLARESHSLGPYTKPLASSRRRNSSSPVFAPERCGPWTLLDLAKTIFALVGFATWERADLLQEAFALRGLLVASLRDLGLEEERQPITSSSSKSAMWDQWVRRESARRTKLMIFCYLNVHSVAYNSHPLLWSSEVHLQLPCLTQDWQARTASQWAGLQRDGKSEQMYLQQALSLLLAGDDNVHKVDPIPSPLGNYILLHALLQRIHLVRELSLPGPGTASLPISEMQSISRGLRHWTSMWQQAPESMLDPNNENGPVPFTSSALLGVAYIRLSLNIGPHRHLETRDPDAIVAGLALMPRIEYNDSFHSALLYSTHSLSIPVRLGIDRVARSQAFFWSVQHALSSFECATFLSKWLMSLPTGSNSRSLSGFERHIIHWVQCIVKEAYAVVDFEEAELPMPTEPYDLGVAVLRIWSRFLKTNTQWQFVAVLGQSLEKLMGSMNESSPTALRG